MVFENSSKRSGRNDPRVKRGSYAAVADDALDDTLLRHSSRKRAIIDFCPHSLPELERNWETRRFSPWWKAFSLFSLYPIGNIFECNLPPNSTLRSERKLEGDQSPPAKRTRKLGRGDKGVSNEQINALLDTRVSSRLKQSFREKTATRAAAIGREEDLVREALVREWYFFPINKQIIDILPFGSLLPRSLSVTRRIEFRDWADGESGNVFRNAWLIRLHCSRDKQMGFYNSSNDDSNERVVFRISATYVVKIVSKTVRSWVERVITARFFSPRGK